MEGAPHPPPGLHLTTGHGQRVTPFSAIPVLALWKIHGAAVSTFFHVTPLLTKQVIMRLVAHLSRFALPASFSATLWLVSLSCTKDLELTLAAYPGTFTAHLVGLLSVLEAPSRRLRRMLEMWGTETERAFSTKSQYRNTLLPRRMLHCETHGW
jgi:hypothetical protein